MSRLVRPSLGSAHALAFLALVLAVGGGYAVAQTGGAPQPTKTFTLARDVPYEVPRAYDSLIAQLVVPAAGRYATSAKLVIFKRHGAAFHPGSVTCFLGSIGKLDQARVTLAPGQWATVSLQSAGGTGGGGTGDAAQDLYCKAANNSLYYVSRVRMTAVAVDSVTEQ